MITFKIHKSDDLQFYVTQQGNNGKLLNTSETVKRKAGAYKNIAAVTKYMKRNSFKIVDLTIA